MKSDHQRVCRIRCLAGYFSFNTGWRHSVRANKMDILIDKFLNETGDSYRLQYYPTELMLYFEKHHIFEIIFDLMVMVQKERPLNVEEYMAEHIVTISKKYYQINTYVNLPDNVVSVTDLVAHHERKWDSFGKALSFGARDNVHTSELIATIVQHRLLQPDCLERGWILVDYPNIADDVKNFFQMLITPNKALWIDTDNDVCRRRKLYRKKCDQIKADCWRRMMFETELQLYNVNHQPLIDAFNEQQSCAQIHFDGNRSYSYILKSIANKLMI
ncbi:adenylate kinase 8 isoform X3 [Anopheles stephensi]|uniref:adenylate kinase 8 isoform X3 n=1 Tax=Anopheles stephensi TaxID=30069 RepID=UPI0016589149|nr:adenylate kinase 8 isoform X3 [Anopheles stephensi]